MKVFRIILPVALLLTGLLLFSSCKKEPTSSIGGLNQYGLPDFDFEGKTKVRVLGRTVSNKIKDRMMEVYGQEVEEIEVPWADLTVRLATMVLSNDSPDAVLFRSDGMDYPNYIINNLVQPINEHIDLTHSHYAKVAKYYPMTEWQKKNYLMVLGMGTSSSMFYNKKLFTDAGMETPWELYLKNEWDWNKLREYAIELTEDRDHDGIPERYGFAMNRAHGLLYTTGKALGSFDSTNLSVVNNVTDPDFARAMNFLSDLIRVDKVCPTSVTDTLEYFSTDSVAMVWGQLFYENPNVIKLAQDGKLGICPLPRDPKVDKYYARGELGSIWMAAGAPNPKGAAAYYTVQLEAGEDTSELEAKYKKYKDEYGYTDENIQQIVANREDVVPVLELTPWLSGGAAWYVILRGSTWDVELAKVKPTVDALIADLFVPMDDDFPITPKIIDDFEKYGDDTQKHIEDYLVSVSGGSNVKMTLDAANAQSGKYAAKVVYDVDDISWGGLEKTVGKTWKNNDSLRFWIKGDGSEQSLSLQFTTLNGGVFVYDFTLSGSAGQILEIPFTEFQNSEDVALDLTRILKIYLYFKDETPGEQCFYIDNLEVYSR